MIDLYLYLYNYVPFKNVENELEELFLPL